MAIMFTFSREMAVKMRPAMPGLRLHSLAHNRQRRPHLLVHLNRMHVLVRQLRKAPAPIPAPAGSSPAPPCAPGNKSSAGNWNWKIPALPHWRDPARRARAPSRARRSVPDSRARSRSLPRAQVTSPRAPHVSRADGRSTMRVPGFSSAKLFLLQTGIFFSISGASVRGCNTLAPL